MSSIYSALYYIFIFFLKAMLFKYFGELLNRKCSTYYLMVYTSSMLTPLSVCSTSHSLLHRCTCCSVWKTRVLVARTISLMLTEHNCWSILYRVYKLMDSKDQNSLHGLLLVASRSVQDRKGLLAHTSNGGKSVLCRVFELHLGSLWIGKRYLC